MPRLESRPAWIDDDQEVPSNLAGDGPTLVLSGGGSLGAYHVGVLKALSRGQAFGDDRPFEPSLIVGTSVGAFNATFLAAQADVSFAQAVDRLEAVWRELIADRGRGNGVYRIRFRPRDYARALAEHPVRFTSMLESDLIAAASRMTGALGRMVGARRPAASFSKAMDLRRVVSMRPFARTIRRTIDFRRLATSPRRLLITAFGLVQPKGRLVSFEGRDPIWRHHGRRLLCGATAIPGVFPPARCEGRILIDPAAGANTPIGPAVRAGAKDLHVVVPWAGECSISASFQAATLDSFYGAQATSWISQAFMHLRDVHFTNKLWQWIEQGADGHHRHRQLASHGVDLPGQGRIETRLYAPSVALGLQLWQFLDFRSDRIARLIDLGYRDARTKGGYDPARSLDQFRSLSLFEDLRYSGEWIG